MRAHTQTHTLQRHTDTHTPTVVTGSTIGELEGGEEGSAHIMPRIPLDSHIKPKVALARFNGCNGQLLRQAALDGFAVLVDVEGPARVLLPC